MLDDCEWPKGCSEDARFETLAPDGSAEMLCDHHFLEWVTLLPWRDDWNDDSEWEVYFYGLSDIGSEYVVRLNVKIEKTT